MTEPIGVREYSGKIPPRTMSQTTRSAPRVFFKMSIYAASVRLGLILKFLLTKCCSRRIKPNRHSLDNSEIKKRSAREWDTLRMEVGEVPEFATCYATAKHFYKNLPWQWGQNTCSEPDFGAKMVPDSYLVGFDTWPIQLGMGDFEFALALDRRSQSCLPRCKGSCNNRNRRDALQSDLCRRWSGLPQKFAVPCRGTANTVRALASTCQFGLARS